MGFADLIPKRSNADTTKVDASWFNVIRQALIDTFDGGGGSSEQRFTIANNQSTYQDITGLILDKTVKSTYILCYELYRKTNSFPIDYIEVGHIYCTFKPLSNTWAFSRRADLGDEDPLGVEDSIIVDPGSGQFKYKSSNLTGPGYVGLFTYKFVLTFNKAP